MPPVRLVIFDCDGVLVDSEPVANRVLAELLTREGAPMTTDQARALFQGRLLAEVDEKAAALLGRPLPAGWIETYEQDRSDAFRAGLTAVAGAREALEALAAAGVASCVASQGRREKTDLSLELTGLAELLPPPRRFSAYEVPRGKPHPDLFLHAAGALGATPADSVVVEDTTIGVAAAVAAGMRAVGYCADGDCATLRAAGAETLDSLLELPAMLGLPAAEG